MVLYSAQESAPGRLKPPQGPLEPPPQGRRKPLQTPSLNLSRHRPFFPPALIFRHPSTQHFKYLVILVYMLVWYFLYDLVFTERFTYCLSSVKLSSCSCLYDPYGLTIIFIMCVCD